METTHAPITIPCAVHHQINSVGFDLAPDGTLTIERSGMPITRLDAKDTFALLQFMRMSGVAALIEAVEIARQTRMQLEYEATLAAESAGKQ